MKIGVVDDGIDQTNPFFNPTGFSYPAGLPEGRHEVDDAEGDRRARLPGPGRRARRDGSRSIRAASFHGTHVAGIAAGDAGTTAPAGRDHPTGHRASPASRRARGSATTASSTCRRRSAHVANTPEIVAAFEAAVSDGMDVINFSGGGPEIDPANDALIEAIAQRRRGRRRPGHLGRERPRRLRPRLGRLAGHRARRDLGRRGLEHARLRARARRHRRPGAPDIARSASRSAARTARVAPARGLDRPAARRRRHDRRHATGSRSSATSAAPPAIRTTRAAQLPAGSLTGAIALVSRGGCTFDSKAERAQAAGAIGIVLVDNRSGEANVIPVELAAPGRDDRRPRRRAPARVHGRARRPDDRARSARDPLELETGRSGVITSFSSGGPTAFDHQLKPDVAAPGGQILSSTLPKSRARRVRRLRRHEHGDAARRGRRRAAARSCTRGWTPEQVKSALISTARPAWGDTARTQEASVPLEGGGLVDVAARRRPEALHRAGLALVRRPGRHARRGEPRRCSSALTDAGGGAGTWQVALEPQAATAGASIDVPGLDHRPAGRRGRRRRRRARRSRRAEGENYGFVVLPAATTRAASRTSSSSTGPRSQARRCCTLKRTPVGRHEQRHDRVDRVPLSGRAVRPPPDHAADATRTAPRRSTQTLVDRPAVNVGVAVVAETPGRSSTRGSSARSTRTTCRATPARRST